MKNQQHQTARELYFNSNLSKTEIADKLNVNRRTIYQWSVDGDWENLRKSARHMPAILAEKCSYIIGHFADSLLSADSSEVVISKTDVDMLHKLTLTLHKLKKGSTVADNMETFSYLLERIQRNDPALALQVAPYTEAYIKERRGKNECSFLLNGFDEQGYLPWSEKDVEEHLRDEEEKAAILAEQQNTLQSAQTPKQEPAAPLQSAPVEFSQTKPVTNHGNTSGANSYAASKPRPVHMPAYTQKAAPPLSKRATAQAA